MSVLSGWTRTFARGSKIRNAKFCKGEKTTASCSECATRIIAATFCRTLLAQKSSLRHNYDLDNDWRNDIVQPSHQRRRQ